MGLRTHRRHVVVWSQSAGPACGNRTRGFIRLGRTGPFRRCVRTCALLTAVGLMRIARAVRPRWRPLLAGGVLTAVGIMLRGSPGGLVVMPGLVFLLFIPLIEAAPDTDRTERSGLARELAAYSTPAQRRDLEATLDRYPDAITHELREILARQGMTAGKTEIPGAGQH
jgi:hypothetical protein